MFGKRKSARRHRQSLILEPIWTPMGVIPGGDDGDVDLSDFDGGGLDSFEGTVDLVDDYTSGVFTVGDSGDITIDFLYDGGFYSNGEVGIFSLEGMDEFEIGSQDFIKEAANRALSGSELGHVVISDATEGARFSGHMGEGNFNSGDYQEGSAVKMRAGDQFGIMLAANHSMEEVAEGKTWSVRFSMSTANPDDGLQFGQVADVTGDGNTFAFEDLSVDSSDRDYNDIVFQIQGATGEAALMDEVVAEGQDWRTDDVGIEILAYTTEVMEKLELENRGRQTFVGIIDTGFAADNPDLDYDNIQLGSDFVDGDTNPLLDDAQGNEHGTHIAGIIGATQDNGLGIDGINDDAPLWFGRAIGSGEWENSLKEFVDAAADSGQPNAVVNLSLDLTQVDANGEVTTRYEFTPQERQAIEYARQNGVLLVVSAGNDGGVMSVLGQASQEFDNIITVGAADGTERADYSSYGNGLDLLAEGGTEENPITSLVDDGIGTMAGTSVATAQVTGAVSRVWAANPELSYRQVIAILKETATDLATPGWDAETGAGLLNLAAAIQVARETQGEVYTPAAIVAPDSWAGAGQFTPGERAVQNYDAHGSGRRFYKGWLRDYNTVDKLWFTVNSFTPNFQFSLDQYGARITLRDKYGDKVVSGSPHNAVAWYGAADLWPGEYYLEVEKKDSDDIDYQVAMNFYGESVGDHDDGTFTLPYPEQPEPEEPETPEPEEPEEPEEPQTPVAPAPGTGKVPANAGSHVNTVTSLLGVVTHYYNNGHLIAGPFGLSYWYQYGTGRSLIDGLLPSPNRPIELENVGKYTFEIKPTTENLTFNRGQDWTTSTGYKFAFQNDGNLVMRNPEGQAIWATGTHDTGADRFVVQADGNVVLYEGSEALWATDTNDNPGAYFAIQGDGNLVVYSSDDDPLFESGTHTDPGTLTASLDWLSTPFTNQQYIQRLYGHSEGTWTRGLDPDHNGIDTTDTVAPYQVRALVGGEVLRMRNGGRVFTDVRWQLTDPEYGSGINPATQMREYQIWNDNNEVVIYNQDLDRTFIYWHFANVDVQVGQDINPGEVLGIEGDTGFSAGQHTHLEVRQGRGTGGAVENPLVTLGNARGREILDRNYH
ncbi:S8 family serine peptidase [Spirulina major]|uniref:S8 family serine peptidase n=1 Tax=Spirulina major TaxID=270636 RepID=UPI0009321E7C|nr:S8 family serine peptidase [Spirulina major]